MEYIYKITNPKGAIYIGKTKDFKKRMSFYKNSLCKSQKKLYNSIVKYGWKNHAIEVIENISKEQVSDREIYWINFFKTNYKRYPENKGLNLSDGGENNKGNNIRRVYEYDITGKYVREWACQNDAVNFYNLGQNHIPQACSGKLKTFGGKRWSYIKHESLSELQGFRDSKKYFDILQINKDGITIKEWKSISHIKMYIPVQEVNIIKCILGERKTHKSFMWKLKN